MCSPSTWANEGNASPRATAVAAIAQPLENTLLDTFIKISSNTNNAFG